MTGQCLPSLRFLSACVLLGALGGACGDGPADPNESSGAAGSAGAAGTSPDTGSSGASTVGGSSAGSAQSMAGTTATPGTGGGGAATGGSSGGLGGGGASSGGASNGGTGGGSDNWDTYAKGFMTMYCVSCHNDDNQGTASRDYHMLAAVEDEADKIACGVAKSQDVWAARGCSGFPPAKQFPVGDGAKPTDQDRDRLIAWIDAGMP